MNPIQFFLNWLCYELNPIIAIVLSTIIIKSICIPIYFIRYVNSSMKGQIKAFTKNYKERKERVFITKELNQYFGIKSRRYLFGLYGIELTILLLYLGAIHNMDNIQVLWFRINSIDDTDYLSLVYLFIISINEIINFRKYETKLEWTIQIIVSILLVILLFTTSKGVITGVVIYWCCACVYNTILRKFVLNRIVNSKSKYKLDLNLLQYACAQIKKEARE